MPLGRGVFASSLVRPRSLIVLHPLLVHRRVKLLLHFILLSHSTMSARRLELLQLYVFCFLKVSLCQLNLAILQAAEQPRRHGEARLTVEVMQLTLEQIRTATATVTTAGGTRARGMRRLTSNLLRCDCRCRRTMHGRLRMKIHLVRTLQRGSNWRDDLRSGRRPRWKT